MERVEDRIPSLRERLGITLTADSPEYRDLCEWDSYGDWATRFAHDDDTTPTRLNLPVAEALLSILELATVTGQHDQGDWASTRESCGMTACGGGWVIYLADLLEPIEDESGILAAKRQTGVADGEHDMRPPLRGLAAYLLGLNGHDAYDMFYRVTERQFISELRNRIEHERNLRHDEALIADDGPAVPPAFEPREL